MRTWIEKLAKISKEEGYYAQVRENIFHHPGITVRSIHWRISPCDIEKYLFITDDNDGCFASIKIYNDEYDLLEDVISILAKKSQDYFINQIENF